VDEQQMLSAMNLNLLQIRTSGTSEAGIINSNETPDSKKRAACSKRSLPMTILAANSWLRRAVIAPVAGLVAALALLEFDDFLVAQGIPKEGTYLDEILMGLIVAAIAVGLDVYHENRLARVHQAAQLMGQLNHHIRNSLQAIVFSSSIAGDSACQDAIRVSIDRIEWALAKIS
jgi:hypothetical protein